MMKKNTGKANKTIRNRMFFYLFIVGFFFVAVVAASISVYEWNNSKARNELYFTNTVRSVSSQLDNLISELDTVACQIIADVDLQGIMKKADAFESNMDNYFEYKVEDRARAQEILWNYCAPKRTAKHIHVFAGSSYVGTGFSPRSRFISELSSDEKWKVALRTYKVLAPHYNDWVDIEERRDEVFSVVRCLIQTKTPFGLLGSIEVQQDYSRISRVCDPLNTQGYELMVFDEQGSIVYPFKDMTSADQLLEVKSQMTEGEVAAFKLGGTLYMGAYDTSSISGWTVLLAQRRILFTEDMQRICATLGLVGMLALLLLSLLFYQISKRISRPIEHLTRTVEEISLDCYAEIAKSPNDFHEIKVLKDSFDSMLDRLQQSTQRLIVAEESELRLKVDQLQAKMSPHFLHNSLALIAAVGAEAGNDLVEELCCQLSDLFRYISADEPQQVNISEEMWHANIYLSFMKYRYEDNFEYECRIVGDAGSQHVNRLVFQPLLENCFRHGFRGVEPPFKIFACCYVDEGGWKFVVDDNGKGFEAEALDRLNQTFARIDEVLEEGRNYQVLQPSNMAIVNIYLRMRLLYQDNIRMHVGNDSSLGGARISIEVKRKVEDTDDTLCDSGR